MNLAVHASSSSVEHYTPAHIVDLAIACLGAIDLDPCSNAHGDAANVPAQTHFTREDDGLARPWHGRVFLNPPYGRTLGPWIDKLVAEHRAYRVPAAVALVPGRPDTQWIRPLAPYLRCEIVGRLTFLGNDDPAPFPSFVYYLGPHRDAFIEAFGALGDIFVAVHTSARASRPCPLFDLPGATSASGVLTGRRRRHTKELPSHGSSF